MVPREHGAYAELLFPMATVFVGGVPTGSTWLLAVAGIACFAANEPFLVLFGHRGARTQREQSGRAARALLLMLFIATAAGVSGLSFASEPARYAVLMPLLLGASVLLLAAQGLERSSIGQAAAAAALSSVAVPLGLTAGLGLRASLTVAAVWLLASLLGTSVVRLTVARTRAKTNAELHRVRAQTTALFLTCLALIGFAMAAPLMLGGPIWVLAAAFPVVLVVLAFSLARPSARRLRSVGWGLVLANLCTLVAVVMALWITTDIETVKSIVPMF